jgi:hypothetical protein
MRKPVERIPAILSDPAKGTSRICGGTLIDSKTPSPIVIVSGHIIGVDAIRIYGGSRPFAVSDYVPEWLP